MKLTLDPGTLVAERFRIVRFIAEGGMGEVYEATDEVLGEPIALKLLSQRNIDDDQVQRRFRREIQLARKVTHPNVCRLYDVFQHTLPLPGVARGSAKVTFVTMELLEGETLEDRIENGGPMSEDEALPIVVQMCHALAAAHDVGIVHRDFKSNNVMLVPADDGRVRAVVTDFGLARSMYPGDPTRTPLTADQLILGTADYMAPEQITGDPVSPRSDIYALGVVMFEMLTGRKPYSAPNPMQLLVLRVSSPPTPPRDFKPDISDDWESVILRCLEEDPTERPASPRELVRGLGMTETTEIGLGISDPSSTAIYFDPRSIDEGMPPGDVRQWWKAAGVAAGILILALVAYLASRTVPPADDRPAAFSPQRITTDEGLEIDPALSPDGERLAYSAEGDDGRFRLFLRSLGERSRDEADAGMADSSTEPKLLTPTLDDAFEAAWSPDGRRLVFHVRGALHGLWLLDVGDGLGSTGSPERLLERGARPSWSPDGQRVAFQSTSSPLLSDTTVPALERSVIEVVRMASRETETLTRPGSPAGGHAAPVWTPDGRFVVFNAVRRSEGELWAMELRDDGMGAVGDPVPIVVGEQAAYDPVVSPDGRYVYFVSRSREVKALWRQAVDEASLEPLGEPQEVAGIGLSSIRQPTVSSDGRMVFSAFHTRSNLWQVPLDAATGRPDPNYVPSQITRGNDRYNRPAFSPDGRSLAFDHWKLGVDIDVFVQSLESGERSQLSDGRGTNSHASWLADGRVAYTENRAGGKRVVAVDPGDGSKEELATLEASDDWAVLSPDGSHLAYHSDAGGRSLDVWMLRLADGASWPFTRHGEAAAFPVWSPDGRWLAYQVRKRGTDGTDLWVQSLDGGEPLKLVSDAGHSWPYSFSPDSRRIAYAAQRGGTWNLWWVDRLTGERQKITESPSTTRYLRYPLFSPYGTSIVYEQAETLSDLYAVELD